MLALKTLLLSALLLITEMELVRAEDDPTFLNTVYLIRNAETNTKKLGSGLSPEGDARAACLPNVFGPGTNMTVGYIIAEPPNKQGNKTEAVDTAAPLAAALGLSIDTSCGRDDKDCVGDALSAFAKLHPNTSMLVVWDTETLPDIAEALGANDVPDFPQKRFDLIWTIQKNKIRAKTSEGCPGLDDEQIALASISSEFVTWTPSFTVPTPLITFVPIATAAGGSGSGDGSGGEEETVTVTAEATVTVTMESEESIETPATTLAALPAPAFVVEGVIAKHGGERRRRSGASWAR